MVASVSSFVKRGVFGVLLALSLLTKRNQKTSPETPAAATPEKPQ
jgi:hypothetical protein